MEAQNVVNKTPEENYRALLAHLQELEANEWQINPEWRERAEDLMAEAEWMASKDMRLRPSKRRKEGAKERLI